MVSVNLTTYNRASLLSRSLESVLNQSYKNIEINIVDDASTDNTQRIVGNYQNKDVRIRYYKHKINLGNARARNTAWQNSNGYFIAFMDDDDEWIDNDKLSKQVEVFDKDEINNIGIICSSVLLIDDTGHGKTKLVQKPSDLSKHILSGNGIIYSPTVLTKKSILDELNGFDENMRKGVDSDFYRNCILKKGYNVIFMEDVTTAIYEVGDDRMTPVLSLKDANLSFKMNLYLINKYKFYFFRYPDVLVIRLKKVFNKYFSLLSK